MATVQEKIDQMNAKKAHIRLGGGAARIEKQHAKGKYTARERLEKLFDEGTFVELDMFMKHRCTNFGQEKKDMPADGVVTGYGTVDGRLVYAYAQDFTVSGGALGEKHAHKIWKVMDLAMKMGAMAASSTATRRRPASSRRSLSSWDRALAALSTAQPLRTSSSW